ncbi:DUF2182 domain-containing protein [uncultured Ruegeria sp.]|uniref:DUF2182 domain-containing protein n=1 Tax=uncultured Ruegeria sp. TaxID=259304 RepID=UPI0026226669|nr:DUF2182 domain-containing protein [uncultured Ruegeria sp.]
MIIFAPHKRAPLTRVSALGVMVILSAWALLIVAQNSALSPYIHHGDWTQAGLLGTICGLGAANFGQFAGLLTGWVVMLFAMMGPVAFRNLAPAGDFSYRAALGYLTVWVCAGVLLHGVGYGVQAAARRSDWLIFNGWSIGAAVLALAGLHQFSDSKRDPLPICAMCNVQLSTDLFTLGLRHGLNCVRSCGLLMCLMFIFFPANVLWMVLITVLIVMDRNSPRLRRDIGSGLIFAAGCIVAVNLS